jgi:ABC-type phosphate transport system substrate-binding protein
MRIRQKLACVIGAVAMGTTLAAAPAPADPPPGVTPATNDIVGVGDFNTDAVMNALSAAYNATTPTPANKLYSWDALPQPSTITPKQGCSPILRPDGSGAGIIALQNDTTGCVDFARSSFMPNPPPANLKFVRFAKDAVSYLGTKTSTSHVVNGLSLANLHDIYTCALNNWNQFGGPTAPIIPILPQANSGTRAFFLAAIGVSVPGACVINGVRSGTTTVIEDSDARELSLALAPGQSADNALIPFSAANYIWYGTLPPTPPPSDPRRGTAAIHSVRDSMGTVVSPISGTAPNEILNTTFASTLLVRSVFNVVKLVGGAVPAKFSPIFSQRGYLCSAAGQNIVARFGFAKIPLLLCGY